MNVFIVLNFNKVNAMNCIRSTCDVLQKAGACIYMDTVYETKLSCLVGVCFEETQKALSKCDCIVSIGGDGTILHSSKLAIQHNIPILGINAGRLGFLAALEENEIHLLHQLIKREYSLEKRMMLSLKHIAGTSEKEYVALNDVVFSTGIQSKMIELDVFCNDKYVISYRSDGVIFASPTGSTAYTLSAGGPIIEPTIDCISMTPICPQTLYNRSMIFNGESVLQVKLPAIEQENLFVSVDGEKGIPLRADDTLLIRKSDKYVNFIDLHVNDFYEVINRKFLGRSQ